MTIERLLDLQAGFQDYILGRGERVRARIMSTPTFPAERRLAIYHHAYRARLADLLADTYARVVSYIGEESFDLAARRFVESHAPTSHNLRDYGAAFPNFLAETFPNDLEVAELAEMDRRLRNAFDAVDADTLCASDIAKVAPDDWDTAVLRLHPTASLQRFEWNTPAIWQHLNDELAPPPAERLARPVTWLFWRKELQPHFRSLSDEEHTALRAISAGQAFGPLCTALAEAYPELDVVAQIGGWLRSWLEDGVLGAWPDANQALPI